MSEFIDLYVKRQALRVQIKKLRSKVDWKQFVKLKDEEKELTEKINKLL